MSEEPKIPENLADLEGKTAAEIIEKALSHFGADRLALATSFGLEDQALTDLIFGHGFKLRIFTLDTGRLFPEVYDVMQKTSEKYGIAYDLYAPDPVELAELVREKGPNLFYLSVENRKACCGVRKVNPLRKALAGMDAWICGLRREQSGDRSLVKPIEWDKANGLWKISPLYDWTEEKVRGYLKEKNVPYCKLQDEGFRSLGCAPCTRAVAPNQDSRAGRWWWEDSGKKECGLHLR